MPTCNQLPNIGTDRGPGGVEEWVLEVKKILHMIRTKRVVIIGMETLNGEKGREK